jgi:hypothetical protein
MSREDDPASAYLRQRDKRHQYYSSYVYGNYVQAVGYASGYNIVDPFPVPGNPDATAEPVNVWEMNYRSWMDLLPRNLSNYNEYVGMLG